MSRISYLITDPSLYTSHPQRFKKRLAIAVQKHNPTFVLYRDKTSFNRSLARSLKDIYKNRLLIHGEWKMAYRFGFYGVHLTSGQLTEISKAKRAGLFVIASTHSFDEILLAKKAGADMVTFSPIFHTPQKGEPKGIKALRKVVKHAKIPILGLGGVVTKRHSDQILKTKAAGYASIRRFITN